MAQKGVSGVTYMKFKADRYILEQIWKAFEEKLIADGRNSLNDFLSQFEGTEISESGVFDGRFSNGPYLVFAGREEWPEYTTVPASSILREWMRKNYPEYLL